MSQKQQTKNIAKQNTVWQASPDTHAAMGDLSGNDINGTINFLLFPKAQL